MAELDFSPNSYGSKAEEDMVNAEAIIPDRRGTPRGGVFWCEQAIEKYFKHVIVQRGGSTLSDRHKLLPLAKAAGFNASEEERLILLELGKMYYERYPTDGDELPEDPTWEELDDIYRLAIKVRTWTLSVVRRRATVAHGGISKMNLK